MKLSAVFTAAFLTASVSATGWRQQPPFPCPKNIANQCTDVEKVGFDWNDLGDDVPVDDYNGYKFEGWTCGSTPGKKSRSTGTQFGSKRIGCGLSKDEFTNTISCPSKEFSVGEIDVSTDVDKVDLEIHYTMPDNSVCKKFAKCYKGGETIPNDQCGGAKSVRIKIPTTSGVKKCNLFIHKIKFVCGNTTTSVPVPTTTIAPPTPTPDCGVPGKPDCATCGVPGKPDCTTDTPTPTPTPDCGVPGKPDCTTDTSTPTPTPDCGIPGKPECGVSTTDSPTTTDAPSTTDTPTTNSPTTTTPGPDCGVEGNPECSASTTDYPTTTDSETTTTPGPDCGVDGKPECTPVPTCGVDGEPECGASTTDSPTTTDAPNTTDSPTTDSPTTTTPGPDCGIDGKPECGASTTDYPTTTDSETTTTPGPDCGVDGKPECTPVPTCGVDGKPECGASTTDYPTTTDAPSTTDTPTTDSPTTTTPGPDCGVDGKPDCTTEVPTTTPGVDCGVDGKPECSGQATTTPGPDCGVYGKPECAPTTTEAPATTPGAECGVDGKPECGLSTTETTTTGDITTTTTILGEPTTSSPAPDCQQNPNAEGCAPTTTPVSPGQTDTPSCGVQGKPECQETTDTPAVITTTLPPVVTTYVPAPPPPSSCPDLVPKCLKTWIFKTSCTDTADAACFCPQPGFIEEVAGCIQAWGQTDSEVTTGLSYLLGLCGDYISKNPTVVTCIPDTITLPPPIDPRTEIPVTQAPVPTQTVIVTNDVTETIIITPTPYNPVPPPGITIIATVTKTEECAPVTITEGPDAGKVVTETTFVKERTITVPNIELIVTKTDVEMIYPPQVSTIYQPRPTEYPVSETTLDSVYVPTTLLTKVPSGFNESQPTMPVQYEGIGSKNKGSATLTGVMGGILVVMLM